MFFPWLTITLSLALFLFLDYIVGSVGSPFLSIARVDVKHSGAAPLVSLSWSIKGKMS